MPPIYEATEDLGIPPTPKGTRLDLTEAQAAPYGKSLKLCKAKDDEPAPEATKVESTDPAADAEKKEAAAAAAAKAEEERIAAEEAAALEKAEEERKKAAESEAEMAGLSEEERKAKGEQITEEAKAQAEADKKAAAEKAAADKKAAEEADKKVAEDKGVTPDDLTKIKGLAAAKQKLLNNEGVFTFQQLIDADATTLSMNVKGASVGTIKGWQDQAKEIIKG